MNDYIKDYLVFPSDFKHGELEEAVLLLAIKLNVSIIRTNKHTRDGSVEITLEEDE
jgi:hypothetical protein